MSLIPPAVTAGSMPASEPVARWWMPKAVGMEGPVMSASSTATFRPLFAIAAAREAVTVLLPTPPFPLTTAITCLMLDMELAGTLRSREPHSAEQLEQSCVQSAMVNTSPSMVVRVFPKGICLQLRYRIRVFSAGISSRVSLEEK